jgi:molybdenum cofactor biosynthesis enzyme MoaA
MNIKDFEIGRYVTYRGFNNGKKDFLLSTYPYLDIVIHDHCNAKCKFCVAHLVHKKEQASLEAQKEKISYAIQKMGVKEVLLLGGEPTINDKLFEYVDYLKQFKLKKICVTTNGHRMAADKSYAAKVLRCGITHLNISLMSFDPDKQQEYSGTKVFLTYSDLVDFRNLAGTSCSIRINNNVFKGNNDTIQEMAQFYYMAYAQVDSVKFSPLLKTDSFSTINEVTEFNRANALSDEGYDALWKDAEYAFSAAETVPILRNKATFGFVEYSMVMLPTPIIFNYNQHGKLREKVIKEHKINNIKLLATGDLSLSWNREEKDWFINTEE